MSQDKPKRKRWISIAVAVAAVIIVALVVMKDDDCFPDPEPSPVPCKGEACPVDEPATTTGEVEQRGETTGSATTGQASESTGVTSE